MEVIKPFESSESMFKKGNLFEAIFGGKMKELLDKVSKFLWVKNNSVDTNTGNNSNANTSNTNETTIEKVSIPTTAVESKQEILWDMTYLAAKYPGQAWAKNNNPSGITIPMSSELRSKLDEAWITYSVGSKRPSNEWWNYVKFNTMDDWIRAKIIGLKKWNKIVRERLAKRVWHKDMAMNYKYADWIIKDAWIDWNKKFSELSDAEMDRLAMKQIKQESRGLYDELIAKHVTPIASNIA